MTGAYSVVVIMENKSRMIYGTHSNAQYLQCRSFHENKLSVRPGSHYSDQYLQCRSYHDKQISFHTWITQKGSVLTVSQLSSQTNIV